MAWQAAAIPALGFVGDVISGGIQASGVRAAAEAQARSQREAIKFQKEMAGKAAGEYDKWDPSRLNGGTYDPLQEYLSQQASVGYTPFEYEKDFQKDFMDPSMAFQQEQMRKQLEASAAAGGKGLRSGAFATELNQNASDLAQRDYANAWQRMSADRDFSYNDYLKKYDIQRQQVMDELAKTKEMIGTGKWASEGKATSYTGLGRDVSGRMADIGDINAYGASAGYKALSGGIQGMTDPTLLGSFFGAAKKDGAGGNEEPATDNGLFDRMNRRGAGAWGNSSYSDGGGTRVLGDVSYGGNLG